MLSMSFSEPERSRVKKNLRIYTYLEMGNNFATAPELSDEPVNQPYVCRLAQSSPKPKLCIS